MYKDGKLVRRTLDIIGSLENTDGAIKNGQSRETGNIGNTRRRINKTKTQHNMCWTPPRANKYK
jgi:hypothetical protein